MYLSVHIAEDLVYEPFHFAFHVRSVFFPVLLFYLSFVLYYFVSISRKDIRNSIADMDDRGINYAEKGTLGSDRYATDEELKEYYEIGDAKEIKETCYGQLSEDGKEIVAYKERKGNKNIMTFGLSGLGKTVAVVIPQLIQALRRGDSIVATDPKGELTTLMVNYAKSLGYDVRILNLLDPEHSDFWDCVGEVMDDETGRVDGKKVTDFVDIFMVNTTTDGEKDGNYWYDTAKNMFVAVIGWCAWQRELYLDSYLTALLRKVGEKDKEYLSLIDIIERSKHGGRPYSFYWLEKKIVEIAMRNGFEEEDVTNVIKRIEEDAPKVTLAKVIELIKDFESLDFTTIPDSNIGKFGYNMLDPTHLDKKVYPQIKSGLSNRFTNLGNPVLRNVLSNKGINLREVNRKKSAYFVIIPDENSYQSITSIFFSFLFKAAKNNYDKEESEAKERGTTNPCLPVTVMLDEFFSCGHLDKYPEFLSVCRSRLISNVIIIQSITMLTQLYGSADANNIISNCNTTLFLGAKDPATLEYISKYEAGDSASIVTESHRETQNLVGTMPVGREYTLSTAMRRVMTIGETRRFKDKILLIDHGRFPAVLNWFPYWEHPVYKEGKLKAQSVSNAVPSYYDRIRIDRYEEGKEIVSPLKMIQNLEPIERIKEEKVSRIDDSFYEQQSLQINEEKKKGRKGRYGNRT